MIQQFLEVPVFSLKEDDIIYNQAHDIIKIVMGVDVPKNSFEREDENSTMSFYAVSAKTYEFDKCHGDLHLETWEVVTCPDFLYHFQS